MLNFLTNKNAPSWVRWLGITVGGAVGATGTVVVGAFVGMSAEVRTSTLTVGAMLLMIGLSGAAITYRSRRSERK
jgi:hypothetical protein